ncbi:MAG: DUF3450 domain-containing protein [Desulfobacteraceae bacterium]|nr:DUF3450 domain-containing protein [Desulfobacteraceae bacterium]
MSYIKKCFLISLFFFICTINSFADTGIKKIDETVSRTIDTEIETQKINSKWQNEKSALQSEFENISYLNEKLQKELQKIEAIHNSELEKNHELLRKQKQIDKIKNELNSFLEKVVFELEEFTQKDLPFHKEERENRITNLKELLLNDEIKAAEKYRQIFEALKIETDYAKTIEVYQNEINVKNETKTADILRIGRVSLFYLTLDKNESGFFNPLTNQYESLDSKFNSKIEKAAAIAKGEQISEFVDLPFGRIAR